MLSLHSVLPKIPYILFYFILLDLRANEAGKTWLFSEPIILAGKEIQAR